MLREHMVIILFYGTEYHKKAKENQASMEGHRHLVFLYLYMELHFISGTAP